MRIVTRGSVAALGPCGAEVLQQENSHRTGAAAFLAQRVRLPKGDPIGPMIPSSLSIGYALSGGILLKADSAPE